MVLAVDRRRPRLNHRTGINHDYINAVLVDVSKVRVDVVSYVLEKQNHKSLSEF